MTEYMVKQIERAFESSVLRTHTLRYIAPGWVAVWEGLDVYGVFTEQTALMRDQIPARLAVRRRRSLTRSASSCLATGAPAANYSEGADGKYLYLYRIGELRRRCVNEGAWAAGLLSVRCPAETQAKCSGELFCTVGTTQVLSGLRLPGAWRKLSRSRLRSRVVASRIARHIHV